jgi:glycerate dehydrogenase
MNIVILDGYTANPGDLSWAEIETLGPCTIFDRTADADIVSRVADAEIVLTNKTVLSADTIARLPKVKMIGVLATGVNVVDVAAAKARGIVVCNVPAYSTPGVAQAVFALLLELTNRTGHHDRTVHEGRWAACEDFCYWDGDLVELAGLTLGIVGYGQIGAAVARVGRAFGMRVFAHRRSASGSVDGGGDYVDLDRLFQESDVVSLHCPLTPDTKELVNAARLGQMKPTAYLINTARGAVVDEAALAAALEAGQLAGAALDVQQQEPCDLTKPPFNDPRVIVTPHAAFVSEESLADLRRRTAQQVVDRLHGHVPPNVVNPSVL